MTFTNHLLTSPLDKYIEAIFHFKDFMPDHSIERVIPTGHIFLLVELDDFPRHTFDKETLKPIQTFTGAWLSGIHRNYISISAHQKSEMFVVQFKAAGFYPFLQQSVAQISERIVPAEQIFGDAILALRVNLLNADKVSDKFTIAEQWLSQRFNSSKTPPASLINTLQQLQSAPATHFQEIITKYPKTQKHLIHQFKKYIGLTPKYYQRILRFNEILQKIQRKENISWSTIAYSCGYADQSHFIKEFKHFSGFNPQDFIHQDLNQAPPNFFPLN